MRRSACALALALLLPLPALAGSVEVKPGETLSEISERYGVSVERLMQLNGLRSAKDLQAGSRINVPGAGGTSGQGAGGTATGAGNYTVKPGETLSEIAERHQTSVATLLRLNGLKDGKDLWAGSRIVVPGAGVTGAKPPAKAVAVNRKARQHQVQPGETLSGIADLYGIPMERLVALNGLTKPDDLMAGDTLQLRAASQAPARQAKPTTVASSPAKPAAKPVVQPVVKPLASKPIPTAAKPSPVAVKPTVAVKPSLVQPTVAKPTTVATATPTAIKPGASPTTSAQPAVTKPIPATPIATKPSAPLATAAKPAMATKPAMAAKPAVAAKPSTPDWRSYGPLQVDWANWQPMGGSYVAPSLNSKGQPLYLAVNCGARRLNATGQTGTWKSWDAPQTDFEEQLITDLCKAKPG